MEVFIFFVIIIFIFLFLFRNKKETSQSNANSNSTLNYTNNVLTKKAVTSKDLFSEYIKLAKISLDKEDYNLAIYYYDKAIALKPFESFCFNNRAFCKSQINDYEGAIEDYTKAIEINRNESQYFANRGIAYWKFGEKVEAIKDWQTAAILGSKVARDWLSQIGHYRENWQDFQNIIIQEEISSLYHFTDRANLDSIIEYGGLFSWYTCEIKGITIPLPGGNALSRDLDIRRNIQDYVRLSFNKNQPMLYVAQREGRIRNPFILEISTEVIYLKNTLFSDENATANSAIIGGEIEDFKRINFNFAKSGEWTNEFEKKYVQAEVLVKSHIPIKFIKNL